MSPGIDSLDVWWKPVGDYAVLECSLKFYVGGAAMDNFTEFQLHGDVSRKLITNLGECRDLNKGNLGLS